jgi:hypothetical protein
MEREKATERGHRRLGPGWLQPTLSDDIDEHTANVGQSCDDSDTKQFRVQHPRIEPVGFRLS